MTDVQLVPLKDSVAVLKPGLILPPNAKPAVCVPKPPKPCLAVFKEPVEVHDVPLYFSVADCAVVPTPGGGAPLPPKAKAAVCKPQPDKFLLAVPKLPPEPQVVPVNSSVAVSSLAVKPPNAKADVCVPQPAKVLLAVANPVGLLVQDVPLYNSVADVAEGVEPPKANAEVCVPAPANCDVVVFKFPTLA